MKGDTSFASHASSASRDKYLMKQKKFMYNIFKKYIKLYKSRKTVYSDSTRQNYLLFLLILCIIVQVIKVESLEMYVALFIRL